MLLRPLKPWHLLLLIPYALVSGLAYGLVAHKVAGEKEPWFTLLMLCGLAFTIGVIAWLGSIAWAYAAWTFAGTGLLYVLMRAGFGRGAAVEIFGFPQIIAVLVLFCWPFYQRFVS
ncbi:MAG: hypothetical protein ACO1TE_11005 [Prosthecobacter sp.]